MNIQEAKQFLTTELNLLIDEGELDEIFLRIAENLSGASRLQLKLDNDIQLDENKLYSIIERLKKSEPIQYVLAEEWFAGLKFFVNHHVLIPRPETEELVQWILNDVKQIPNQQLNIIDIGTGSGCIPIVLKKSNSNFNMKAIDISKEALQVAQRNANSYLLEIQFIQEDILKPSSSYPMFDIIVSNPPYITNEEKDEMNNRVLDFEPHQALFVTNQDPLQFYKAILKFAQNHLNENGAIYVELNRDYGEQTELLFKNQGYLTNLRKDMYGNTRMLKAQKKNLPI